MPFLQVRGPKVKSRRIIRIIRSTAHWHEGNEFDAPFDQPTTDLVSLCTMCRRSRGRRCFWSLAHRSEACWDQPWNVLTKGKTWADVRWGQSEVGHRFLLCTKLIQDKFLEWDKLALLGGMSALHPGNKQPTLPPTHNCCLNFTDCVGVSRQSRKEHRAPNLIAQEHEKGVQTVENPPHRCDRCARVPSALLHSAAHEVRLLRVDKLHSLPSTPCIWCCKLHHVFHAHTKWILHSELEQRHKICGGRNKTVPFAKTKSDSSPPHSSTWKRHRGTEAPKRAQSALRYASSTRVGQITFGYSPVAAIPNDSAFLTALHCT